LAWRQIVDDLLRHKRERWNGLARAGVAYSVLWMDLDEASARGRVDPLGLLGDVAGKRVLCLAGGGGQQSAAFGLLGARVTVFDLSDEMLARDRAAAAHYQIALETMQGDAQDLAVLADEAFDIVWQAHSLPFMPRLDRVYDGVRRILRTGGVYHLSGWNPLAHGAFERWTGQGYLLNEGYTEGAETISGDGCWKVVDAQGQVQRVPGPREFRHTLTDVVNGLIARGFLLLDVHEEPQGRADAAPGTWDHFCALAPPWLCIWAVRQPALMEQALAEGRGR